MGITARALLPTWVRTARSPMMLALSSLVRMVPHVAQCWVRMTITAVARQASQMLTVPRILMIVFLHPASYHWCAMIELMATIVPVQKVCTFILTVISHLFSLAAEL